MAGSTGGTASSHSSAPPAPKILLAKPSAGPLPSKFGRGVSEDEAVLHRSRLTPVGSLNLLSDAWDFHIDRFLPFLTENTDFTVIGVIGPPGVGKSTIMNEIYGYDGTSPGMLPPFTIQSEETRVMARHCSIGIEPRISAERFILLDIQPFYSPSVLAEMMRPDGSSTIPVLSGESLSSELAHELMGVQLGVLLASICHVLLVVSEGVHDNTMWRLMLTVDLLKHGIPDPSSVSPPHSHNPNLGSEKESKENVRDCKEYMATPVLVLTKLQDQDLTPHNTLQLRKALGRYFSSSSFAKEQSSVIGKDHSSPPISEDHDSTLPKSFMIPTVNKDDSQNAQHESYRSAIRKLRDQILSMDCPSFTRTVSERDWLKNSAKIWEMVKSSPIIAEYSKVLQCSGMFRR